MDKIRRMRDEEPRDASGAAANLGIILVAGITFALIFIIGVLAIWVF